MVTFSPLGFAARNNVSGPNIWWKPAKRRKIGGNRQNGQKNLVETGKTAKKIWWYYVFKVYSPLKLLIMEDGVIYFKRKIYDTMLKWKSERNGETALLIQGARRVGKSTIAEEFARHEYKSYILIDFSKVSKEVSDLFSDISDLNYLFIRLQFIYQVQLYERNSVIIFDEVQLQPLARQAIKHLVKDRRYDYIETGSLISVRSKSRNIIIPSEETKVDMYPMDYEEFRWALGDTTTIALLRAAFEKKMPLGDAVHRKLMRDFRLYMLVGGMPQAVATYIRTNNFSSVDLVKRDIIALYEEDFEKIDLRVCKIVKCQEIRKSNNCYKLTLFDGEGERVIVSSIKHYYTPEQLIGKKIIVVANLKPVRITGVTSNGMLVAATNNACGCQVVFVDDIVPEGTMIK